METYSIFFSYQSDIPQNKSMFMDIKKKLQKRFSKQNIDLKVKVGTYNTSGNPPILSEMLELAKTSDIFIADLTYIATQTLAHKAKHIPNPNVLLELGHAWNFFDTHHIIFIQNSRYGDGSLLPVDLKEFRWPITFSLPKRKKVSNEEYKQVCEKFLSEIYSAINIAINDVRSKLNNQFTPFAIFNTWKPAKFECFFRETKENVKILNNIKDNLHNNKHICLKGDKNSGRSRLIFEALNSLEEKVKNNIYYCNANTFAKSDIAKALVSIKTHKERNYIFVILDCPNELFEDLKDEYFYKTNHLIIATMLYDKCYISDAIDAYQGFTPNTETEEVEINSDTILSDYKEMIEFLNNYPPYSSSGKIELFYRDIINTKLILPEFINSEVGQIAFLVLASTYPDLILDSLKTLLALHPDYVISDNKAIIDGLHHLFDKKETFLSSLRFISAIYKKEGDEFLNIRRWLLPKFKMSPRHDYELIIDGLKIIEEGNNFILLKECIRSVFHLDNITVSLMTKKEKKYIEDILNFIMRIDTPLRHPDLQYILVEAAWICGLVDIWTIFKEKFDLFTDGQTFTKEDLDRLMWTAVQFKNKGKEEEYKSIISSINKVKSTNIEERMRICLIDAPYTYAKKGEELIDLVQDFVKYCREHPEWIEHIDILLQGEQRQTYNFGKLIANTIDDLDKIIDRCIDIYKNIPQCDRNYNLIIGLIEGKYGDIDSELRKVRNKMLNVEELKESAYDFSNYFKQNIDDFILLIDTQLADKTIDIGKLPLNLFPISDKEIELILKKISTNPNYDSFMLRFIFELNITLNPEFDTSSLLCEILKKANYWNDDNQGFESVFYYFISDIIYALKKFNNQELKEELSKSIIKHSIKDNFNSMDSLYHLTETINQIMLDEFLSDISIYISNNNFTELRNWNLSSMLNKCKDLNTNKMITWYKSNPNHVSLIFLLSSLPLFEDSTEESFSNEILFLLNEIRIFSDLDFLDMRLNTYTSNGEDIMCSRKKAVEKLISNKNELIQKWAIEEKSKIERNQEREKEMLGHFFKKQDYSILENN